MNKIKKKIARRTLTVANKLIKKSPINWHPKHDKLIRKELQRLLALAYIEGCKDTLNL